MTAGMTLEGLHHAGGLGKDFLVILNDNQMSISKNVGAISAYLSRTITGEFYGKVREETGQLLRKIPHIGPDMQKLARRAEELAKGAILPGLLFEELGFKYSGPIDGHNFEHLIPTFENVLKMKGPVLLHVITKKGLGYEPAVKNPVWFHACPPFVRETGGPRRRRRGRPIRRSPSNRWLSWPERISGSSRLRPQCAKGPASIFSKKSFRTGFTMWGLPNNMR